MQHRGVEFRVRRTLTPEGWKWSVSFGGREKSGWFPERDGAVRLAQQFIDGLIKDRPPLWSRPWCNAIETRHRRWFTLATPTQVAPRMRAEIKRAAAVTTPASAQPKRWCRRLSCSP
jgi:hypothetical protein